MNIRDVMTPNPCCVSPDDTMVEATPDMSTREAAELMSEHQVRRLPVVENNRLVGAVTLTRQTLVFSHNSGALVSLS